MDEPITWHKQDNDLQYLSNDLTGWSAQIWNFGSHPINPPHPAGQPFNWSISPSMMLTDGPDREGYSATLADAQADAERHLRELAARPAPRDEALAAYAETMRGDR